MKAETKDIHAYIDQTGLATRAVPIPTQCNMYVVLDDDDEEDGKVVIDGTFDSIMAGTGSGTVQLLLYRTPSSR